MAAFGHERTFGAGLLPVKSTHSDWYANKSASVNPQDIYFRTAYDQFTAFAGGRIYDINPELIADQKRIHKF